MAYRICLLHNLSRTLNSIQTNTLIGYTTSIYFFPFRFQMSLSVGPSGEYIDGDVLGRLLCHDVIGHDPRIAVLSPLEATSLTYPSPDVANTDTTCTMYPNAQYIIMPVCVGGIDQLAPIYESAHSQAGHYVLITANFRIKQLVVYDSLVTRDTFEYLTDKLPALTANIWGHSVPTCTLIFVHCHQQRPWSNDCAVFVFANVCTILSQIPMHVIPFSPTVRPTFSELSNRDFFRSLWNRVNTKRLRETS